MATKGGRVLSGQFLLPADKDWRAARSTKDRDEVADGCGREPLVADADRLGDLLAVASVRELADQPVGDGLHGRLPQAAATVTSATFEVLTWNDLAAALMEDFSAVPRGERNLVRRVFLGPHTHGRRRYGVSDADAFARTSTQRLR